MTRTIRWFAVTALILFIIIKGTAVFLYLKEYKQAKQTYEDIGKLADVIEPDADSSSENTDNRGENSYCPISPDFDELKKINQDTVGWLYLPDTVLNYPVVQGDDNEYYLTHMFDGTKNSSGSIFIDCDNDINSDAYNTVIYGHHMKNGSMFAVLSKYRAKEWYESHPYLWFVTPGCAYKLHVYSVYTAKVSQDAWNVKFDGQEDYEKWLAETKNRSEISTDIWPNENDRVITLSTCSYEFENARLVIHATIDRTGP